ncbi:MAG: PQQ-binding-like beta-propeller repeat protein [Planctomycetes bacterium]|nr:PQQ-binding-like beta-propeller repeat protein [Planctomycetota bacterium]
MGSGELLNTEEVDFLLEAAPAQSPTPDGEAATGEQIVTMRGDLDQINLADIFQTLAMTKMEGMLRVSNPIEHRYVWFKGGFVRIVVPNRVTTRRLGQRLVQAGLLQTDQLRMALLEQRKDNRPLGAILAAQAWVTVEQIEEIVAVQVTEELFSLFTWRHGTFEFYKGEVTDPNLQQQLEQVPEFEVNSLMLEVARRSDEWEGIIAALGSLDEIPTRVAQPAEAEQLGEVHRAMLLGADARLTYRQIAEQSLHPLFDAARAARDLVRDGLLANIPDDAVVELARTFTEQGHQKQALMAAQTLRDRPGERPIPVIEALADVLQACGEHRVASHWLIEIAQLQTDGEVALRLARKARALYGRDPGTLSFLRTTMLAHSSPTSEELEELTVQLLDALLEKNETERVLELTEDARKTGTATPTVLLRLARALQKRRETPAAVTVLLEIAAQHEAAGRRKQLIETYEQVVKLDRSRRDLLKQLRQLKSTKATRLIRLAAGIVSTLLLGAMGLVWWDQDRYEADLAAAGSEISGLLQAGNRLAATEALDRWRERLGPIEPLEDLHSQIMFADAAEHARLRREERKRAADRLGKAAQLLEDGDLSGALAAYAGLLERQDLAEEVREVVSTRLSALAEDLEVATKRIAANIPEPPSRRLERPQIEQVLTALGGLARPGLTRMVGAVDENAGLPNWLPIEVRNRLTHAIADARPALTRLAQRTQQYEAAAFQADNERRLDPLFKSAMDLERALDFHGALAAYRRLESEHTGEPGLKTHFRDQVERYATICQFLDAIAKATAAADFATAQQQYRALCMAFPALPFDRIARLPMTITTEPAGATVLWNGIEAGKTPCVVAFVPANRSTVLLRLDGFLPEHATVNGDHIGALQALMTRKPDWRIELPGVVDQPVAHDERGRLFAVDRSGTITCLHGDSGRVAWQHPTGDLSGLLTTPLVIGNLVCVGSYDGTLRAFDRASGKPAWNSERLPTELPLRRLDDAFVLATLDQRLVLVDPATGEVRATRTLPALARGDLWVLGKHALVALAGGHLASIDFDPLGSGWQKSWPDAGEFRVVLADSMPIVAGEDGSLRGLDPTTGNVTWNRSLGESTTAIGAHGATVAVALTDRVLIADGRNGQDLGRHGGGEPIPAGVPVLTPGQVLIPRKNATVAVGSKTADRPAYLLRGAKRITQITPLGVGAIVASADRRLAIYQRLP